MTDDGKPVDLDTDCRRISVCMFQDEMIGAFEIRLLVQIQTKIFSRQLTRMSIIQELDAHG